MLRVVSILTAILSFQPEYKRLLEAEQKMGDGQLEFLVFSSAASLGFERLMVSVGANKLAAAFLGFPLSFNRL